MAVEQIDTVVVGGGQAGIAMSEHLGKCGIDHVVLEKHRIAESWRSARWDSLVTNGPVWHDRFPGMEFPDLDPDAFASKEAVADYFVAYANMIKAPVRSGVEVKSVQRLGAHSGFQVETSLGTIETNNVVAATGSFQVPIIPAVVPSVHNLTQIHSHAYRNSAQLPSGAVLVVGAGSSGSQIADDLLSAGRRVYLSVGPHDRPPRRYRQRDFVWWLGVLGKWDAQFTPGREHVTIAVSGARGGETVDFRNLEGRGVTLVGMTKSFSNGAMEFAADLAANIANGDANYLSVLDEADAYVKRNAIDLPQEPEARQFAPMPGCVDDPILRLNLKEADIRTIIWATGYTVDYNWLKLDVLDERGKPKHMRGVTSEPGIYFLGLPWQSRRGSSFIWGVWHDAKFLADQIAIQKSYRTYRPSGTASQTTQALTGDLNDRSHTHSKVQYQGHISRAEAR